MSYYQTLGLIREPFSSSPDPDLLYRSKTHLECLQHMEIAVRLRRGLNVVLGDVGTGKTTLCRELLRILAEDPDLEIYLLDDPYAPNIEDFLLGLCRLLGVHAEGMAGDQGLLKNAIKAALAEKSVDGRRIVTLLVDEGQKITGECLELLRELLNFETNTHKLLQIVIFAQKEFDEILVARPNLDDRINYRYELRPLDGQNTRRLIRARLNLCAADGQTPELFTNAAMRRIYRATGGYPRKIVRLCHLSMLLCVGLGHRRVTWGLVGRAVRESRGRETGWRGRLTLAAAGAGLSLFLVATGFGLRAMLPGPAQAPSAARIAAPAVPADVPGTPGPAASTLAAHAEATGPSSASSMASSHDADPSQASVPETVSAAQTAQADMPAEAANPGQPSTVPGPVTENQPAPAAASTPTVQAAVPTAPAAPVAPAPKAVSEAPLGSVVMLDPEEPVVTVAATSAERQIPASLGSSVTRQGWTLSQQAVWLYGQSNRQVMNQLAKANPGLDFNRIRAGQSITFPAIKADAVPSGECLIKLGEVKNLENGFVYLARNRAGALPLALFVTFQPGAGLRYEVVAQELYPDAAAAKAALETLPPALAATATLVAEYPNGTVFYSDLVGAMARRTSTKMAQADGPQRQVASREAR